MGEVQSYTWRFRIRSIANEALNWVFPPQQGTCLLCQRPLYTLPPRGAADADTASSSSAEVPDGVCLFCIQDAVGATGQVQPRQITVSGRRVTVFPAMAYEGLTRTAIRKWKYDGVMSLTEWFGTQLATACVPLMTRARLDCIVPVPTSLDRFRKRGYHHVGLLAEDLGRRLHLPVHEYLIRRPSADGTFTQSQTAKSVAERRQSLVGAFGPHPEAAIAGQRLLLLDDVVTTGATIEACASQLLAAGATSVVCAAIALVESPHSTRATPS